MNHRANHGLEKAQHIHVPAFKHFKHILHHQTTGKGAQT
jgi:hypothetical protein